MEKGPGKGLDQIISSLVKAGENFQVLSNKKLKEKFPELSFSPHYSAVLETSAGVLKADKCLRVLQVSEKVFEGLCLSYIFRHFEVVQESRSTWLSKCIIGLFWGMHFQHGGKFPQCTLTTILTRSLAQPQSGE